MPPRRRRPRGSLSPEVILDAAEAVAVQGFDTFSMRAVAARLEAVPMALYNHFETKEQLVDALLDRVLTRFEPPPPQGDWIDDLRAFAHAHRRVLTDHPWAVAEIFKHPNPGPAAIGIGEHAFGILARGGLSQDDAVAAFSGLLALNYGWSSFLVTGALQAGYGSDEHYAFVLDRLLAGLGPPAEG
jgi:AcrR family transcriptional regulator